MSTGPECTRDTGEDVAADVEIGSYGDGDTGIFDPIAARLLDTGQHEQYAAYMASKAERLAEAAHEPGAETRNDRHEDGVFYQP